MKHPDSAGGWFSRYPCAVVVFAALTTLLSSPLHAVPSERLVSEVPKIGVVGDSLSDEYALYPYGIQERNWVQILATTGYGDMGRFASFRMYPRLYGYAFNWARAGATTRALLAEGQVQGLIGQIRTGAVEVAVVMIGANDIGGAYRALYEGQWSAEEIETFLSELRDNMIEIVRPLAAAEPSILLVATIPDPGDTPSHRFGRRMDAEKRQRVTEVIERANRDIAAIAADHDAVLLDIYTLLKDKMQHAEFRFHGFRISTLSGGLAPHHFFTIDEFHPGSLAQAFLGNVILEHIENERVRLLNLQTESHWLNEPGDERGEMPVHVPQYHLVPAPTIFELVGVAPNADIYFPGSQFTDRSENVIRSSWFGVLAIDPFPWINHAEHGWLYCDGYGGDELRFYDSHLGWLQTTPELYPLLIRESDHHVLRYQSGSSQPRRFFDETAQGWIEIPYGARITELE